MTDFRKKHHKFISTQAAYGIGASHTTNQARCNRLKHFVAESMSQRIIDMFESIQIQVHHGDSGVVPTGSCDRLVHSIRQQHAVR